MLGFLRKNFVSDSACVICLDTPMPYRYCIVMATRKATKKRVKKWVDLGIRGTSEENELLIKAAAFKRQSRCQFVLMVALEEARKVVLTAERQANE